MCRNYTHETLKVFDIKLITTKDTNDCMDAGGRAPTVGALGDAGAVAESTKYQ